MEACVECVENVEMLWCPMKNDFLKGICYDQKVDSPNELKALNLDYCSNQMIEANTQVRKELQMFSCPFQSYCGSNDLETIVPTFDGEKR